MSASKGPQITRQILDKLRTIFDDKVALYSKINEDMHSKPQNPASSAGLIKEKAANLKKKLGKRLQKGTNASRLMREATPVRLRLQYNG